MPAAVVHFDAQCARPAIAGDFHVHDFIGTDDAAPLVECLPETRASATPVEVEAHVSPSSASTDLHGLSERMRLLAHIAGGASAVARRCGFSEGAVRGWCHGRSDMSRERCAIIARTLGVSLRWLVTGEGPMRDADDTDPDIHASMPQTTPAPPSNADEVALMVDPGLLAAAFRVLQSYIVLVGGSLNPLQRADAVAQIYQSLARAGGAAQADRLVALHATLGGYFCSRKSLIG